MLGIHLFGLRTPIGHRAVAPPAGHWAVDLVFCGDGESGETTDARRSSGDRRASTVLGRPATRPEGACVTVAPAVHDGLRTVRQGGDARRSAARRDLATVRADAFRSLLRAMLARLRKPLLG